MDLSGNIRFANFLTLGYSRLQDFRLGAIFLDENGKVLEEIGLATNRGSFHPIPFHRRIKSCRPMPFSWLSATKGKLSRVEMRMAAG